MVELEMVDMNSNKNQQTLNCILRNDLIENKPKFTMSINGNISISEFYMLVAEKVSFLNGTFQISYLTVNGETFLNEDLKEAISNFLDPSETKQKFLIKAKNTITSVKIAKENDDLDGAQKDGKTKGDDRHLESLFSSSHPLKSDTGFVGLVNQAMTCYLNSLLQTLFMTPEFRNALYQCKYDGLVDDTSSSIPFQLQKLFLLLETSHKKAVETTELTKSFGWDSGEAWQQHDVQELCRVMFDALEESLKDTEQKDLIKELYQGELEDYVKCQKCNHENIRKDYYLDISVDMKPFGSDKSYESLEEALRAFVKPEILDGNNQYFCGKCNSKQDAHKGLKFVSFPYLLTIQLKRFTFNFKTLQREKLHDRMTFPFKLDLHEFIKSTEEDASLLNRKHISENEDCLYTISEKFEKDDSSLKENHEIENYTSAPKNPETKDASLVNEKCPVNENESYTAAPRNSEKKKCKKKFLYELYSILIHSGSTLGGHYYAYIKLFTNGKWYCFNDQYVSEISESEIEKSYGGHNKYGGYYSSSSNAYMLMYRKIDKKNKIFIKKEDWPVHLSKLCSSLLSETNTVKEKSVCKIKLFGFHPLHGNKVEAMLDIFQNDTLKEATEKAWKILGFHEYIPLCQCRLIKYEDSSNSIQMSFEEEETSLLKLMGNTCLYLFDLLLEWRKENEQFQVYKSGGVTLKVYIDDKSGDLFEEPFLLHISLNSTIEELKQRISFQRGQEFSKLVVWKEYLGFLLLDNPEKTLKMEGFYKFAKIFLTDNFTGDFKESLFYKKLEEFYDTIKLFIVRPPFQAEDQTKKAELVLSINRKKTVGDLKKKIEPLINVEQHMFRIYRLLNDQENELIKLEDTLQNCKDGTKMVIKLGRALMTGESRIKVYLFEPNNEEPMTFFMEAVVCKGMAVYEFKEQILLELNRLGKDYTLERIRIRGKSYKNPSRIYTNNYKFEIDIKITFGAELLVELLQENDIIVNEDYLNLYARRWRPSQYKLDQLEEIILYKDTTLDNLKRKLSEISGIPTDQISIAKANGNFPCLVALPDINCELNWDQVSQKLGEYPLLINDDGAVIYYRDAKEETKQLTVAERMELRNGERKQKTPRQSKEKALKIWRTNGVKS